MPSSALNFVSSLGKALKEHGQILLVMDQPATVGALPVAVARAEGAWVAAKRAEESHHGPRQNVNHLHGSCANAA
ncbi:MAG: hypothetical protein ACJ8R9_22100 [Steroidobacteraceae bacterium]